MNAKFLRALLCLVVMGAFSAPPATAGVFQLVEIASNTTIVEENRFGADPDDDTDDGETEEGSRTIQPSLSVQLFELLLQLVGSPRG